MIYFIQAEDSNHIKIGFTSGDESDARMATLQTGCSSRLRLLGTIPGSLADEKDLHRRFAAARVSGEWFQPTGELLALIPAQDGLVCGPVQVTSQSVSIRVLTVGRKQFSRSLLDQLPERELIDWWSLALDLSEDIPVGVQIKKWLASYDLSKENKADIWGWIEGGADDCYKEFRFKVRYRWIIHCKNCVLYKCKDYDQLSTEGSEDKQRIEVLIELHAMRIKLVGWRPEDQLFIGV